MVQALWQDHELKDYQGWTVLHMASAHGRADLTAYLVANMNPDTLKRIIDLRPNRLDSTPLHLCLTLYHFETAGILVSAGANLSEENGRSDSALTAAIRNKAPASLIELMLKQGADTRERNYSIETSFKADGARPLHLAIYNGSPISVVRLLLQYGAAVHDTLDNWGHRASSARGPGDYVDRQHGRCLHNSLHIAALFPTTKETIALLARADIAAGSRAISARDCQGQTPVHLATKFGIMGIVDLVKEYPTEIPLFVKDDEGKSPLDIAMQFGQEAAVKTLQEARGSRQLYEREKIKA